MFSKNNMGFNDGMMPSKFGSTNFNSNTNTNTVDVDVDVNVDSAMGGDFHNGGMMGSCSRPMVEPMQERCIHRTIVHEVPHVCPIRTRVINHHVFKHTYRPEFSCCEENVCSNVQCGSCCGNNNNRCCR